MIKITYEEIQKVNDEESLLKFLKTTLNLPIPKELKLEDIAIRYSNYALGLSGSDNEQVVDCFELSLLPGKPSGMFFILFKSEHRYSEVLQRVAKSLEQRENKLSDLRFICIHQNYQPFAFACFKDDPNGDSQSKKLNINVWSAENVFINVDFMHEIPASFFSYSTIVKQENQQEQQDFNPTSYPNLITKLEHIGTPLIEHVEMYGGQRISLSCSAAFLIDEQIRKQFIAADSACEKLITPVVHKPRKNKKWSVERKYLIWISSSEYTRWQWSDEENEAKAERVFSNVHPTISKHIGNFKAQIKNLKPEMRGKFFWELPIDKNKEKVHAPKIIYHADGFYLNAAYDESETYILGNWTCFIPTDDLSLLAILNSKLFSFYAKKHFQAKFSYKSDVPLNWLTFKKKNMKNFPVANRKSVHKTELSDCVRKILEDPQDSIFSDLEEKINQIVYRLYDLTPKEIKLIEDETRR